MNEVVVKGFFPPFFVAAVARGQDINVSPRGGCGVPPGDEGVRSTCQVYPWIDRHCEIRHIIVNHCLNTVKELQWWKIGLYASVDGINDELMVVAMQNVWFFSMHGVSKMLEWSIIRVRWANRRLGQCAGEWSSCERFFLIFLGCCGCKGPRQWSAATRGCRGTAAHFYNHRDFFSFFLITVIVKSFILM